VWKITLPADLPFIAAADKDECFYHIYKDKQCRAASDTSELTCPAAPATGQYRQYRRGRPSDLPGSKQHQADLEIDAPHLLQLEAAVRQILRPFRHKADAQSGRDGSLEGEFTKGCEKTRTTGSLLSRGSARGDIWFFRG